MATVSEGMPNISSTPTGMNSPLFRSASHLKISRDLRKIKNFGGHQRDLVESSQVSGEFLITKHLPNT
jgi:hypothetical protein